MIQYTRYTGAALLLFKYNPKIMAHVITYIWVKCNTDLLLELTSSFFRYSSNTNTHTQMKWPMNLGSQLFLRYL